MEKRTGKGILYSSDFMEVLGVRKTQSAHAECMSGFLEMAIEVFPCGGSTLDSEVK